MIILLSVSINMFCCNCALDCSVTLSRGAVGLFMVCDCVVFPGLVIYSFGSEITKIVFNYVILYGGLKQCALNES